MPPAVTIAFKSWLKGNTGMKLSSDASVNRITYEGITNYDSLLDLDTKSIQSLASICKESIPLIEADAVAGIEAENAVPGANINTITTRRLIIAMHAAKYYTSIRRTMSPASMHYTNVLANFKIEWEDYESLIKQDEPSIPAVDDKDNDRKIIKWIPIFLDCTSRTYGSRGPLAYVLREEDTVPDEADDPLLLQAYYGQSGSLIEELIARLPHEGAIFKNDNATVYMMIEKSVRGTSVESTVKGFSRRKDGRGAYFALISNHAGDTKYRSIMKKKMNFLQNQTWNGRSYQLENHITNHRSAVDDIRECSQHITVAVPDQAQRVEYLIDSITCSDSTLQAAIGLVRANTNNMREDFEAAASSLIEVDPYRRSNKQGGNPRNANVSAIDFSAGRGTTGVDLRWHSRKEFSKLPEDHQNELRKWIKTQEGKKALKKARSNNKRKGEDNSKTTGGSPNGGSNWKKKMKDAMKTQSGLKSVMSVLAAEEQTNQKFAEALSKNTSPLPPSPAAQVATPPPAAAAQASALSVRFPTTSIKLQDIIKHN
jgi:hypothetical protein